MPLFAYVCHDCQAESELLVRGSEKPVCPHCESKRLVKQLSTFATVSGSKNDMPMGCGAPSCCRGGSCSMN